MKKHLIVYYGNTPECVEGFLKECKRSCKGALHVKPGVRLEITCGELKHIKKKYEHMLLKLKVISTRPDKVEAEKEPIKAPKEVQAETVEEPKAQTGKNKKKKKK